MSEQAPGGLHLVARNGDLVQVTSLRDIPSKEHARTHLVFDMGTQAFVYPKTTPVVHGLTLEAEPEECRIRFKVNTDLTGLLQVTDPKKTSPEVMAKLKEYHQYEVSEAFIDSLFIGDRMVLPGDVPMFILAGNSKTFVFRGGNCWEITMSNTIVNVLRVPDLPVLAVKFGEFTSAACPFTYVAYHTYASDISFPGKA